MEKLKKLVGQKNRQCFKLLETDLKNNIHSYSKELQQVILLSLINTCNYYIRIKDFSYRKKILELYEFGLHTGISLNNGKLSERRFLNMVDVKSKVANSTDSTDFIEEWLKLTNTKHEKTLRNLAKAIWYFAKEAYKEAYDYTRFVEITLKDINISHRLRLIKICSLYSLDDKYPFFRQEIKKARDFYLYAEKKKKLSLSILTGAENLILILEKLYNKENYEVIKSFKEDCDCIVHEFWVEKILIKMAQKR